ncbi:phage holin family protein, partial [Staphylococcus aureus]
REMRSSVTVSSDSTAELTWNPRRPRFNVVHVAVSWICAAVAVFVAGLIVPGVTVVSFLDAFVAAALLAVLNAVLPPIVAAL